MQKPAGTSVAGEVVFCDMFKRMANDVQRRIDKNKLMLNDVLKPNDV